jgi:hypothetical protein
MKKLDGLWLSAVVGCVFGVAASALAAEGGSSNYPYGALTTYAALLPPPGTNEFFGYVVYYPARIVDDHGEKIPGTGVDLIATAPRIIHTWKQQLAGFDLSSGGTIELLHSSVFVPGEKDQAVGPTLLGLEPIYLTRAFGTFHFLTGPVLYLPLGSYNSKNLANSTTGFTSYAFQVSGTWIPTPLWDFSLAAVTEFKERNKQTGYLSGKQAGVSFGLSHRPLADTRWEIGVTGFFTKQINEDEDGGVRLEGSHTQKWAVGPKLGFWLTPATPLIFQWHKEQDVRNAPRGNLYWLEFGFPLN